VADSEVVADSPVVANIQGAAADSDRSFVGTGRIRREPAGAAGGTVVAELASLRHADLSLQAAEQPEVEVGLGPDAATRHPGSPQATSQAQCRHLFQY
jgi:hypothetical protein